MKISRDSVVSLLKEADIPFDNRLRTETLVDIAIENGLCNDASELSQKTVEKVNDFDDVEIVINAIQPIPGMENCDIAKTHYKLTEPRPGIGYNYNLLIRCNGTGMNYAEKKKPTASSIFERAKQIIKMQKNI